MRENSKKILIVAYNTLEVLGGIEHYNKSLVNIIKNNFNDTEIHFAIITFQKDKSKDVVINEIYYHFITQLELKSNNWLQKTINISRKIKHVNKFIYELYKKYNFDLMINSTYMNLKLISSNENYFLVQHSELYGDYIPILFSRKRTIFNFLQNFYLRYFLKTINIIKKAKNIVVYDEKNSFKLKKYYRNNIYIIPLFSDIYKYDININKNNRKKILYLGRISNPDKNIEGLIRLNEKIGLIDFFGVATNEEENKWKNLLIKHNWYIGNSDNKEEIFKLLNTYKFLIIYSNHEGFSFSIVEALSLGVPVIVKNTFTSASFLCNKNTGLLLDRHSTIEQDIKKIQNFYNMDEFEYEKYVESSKLFYEKELTYQIFVEKWLAILKKFL